MDRAGKGYWDNCWSSERLPDAVDPNEYKLDNYMNLQFHHFFSNVFSGMEKGSRLLEIGCAKSIWLPYFSKQYQFNITGLDYSEIGCEQEKKMLENEGVEGEIICSDFFNPPENMIESFDILVSFGVLEHFDDTVGAVKAFSRFLKKGGIMITSIPNMAGINGFLQKKINRKIYDIHVPLKKEELAEAHSSAGLQVLFCDYFLCGNLGVINLENLQGKSYYHSLLLLRSWISKALWITEGVLPIVKSNSFSSPYIICNSKKA